MFKYEIENELKALYPIELCAFKSYLGKLTLDQNKIIFFGNTSTKYYSYYCTYCQKWHFILLRNIGGGTPTVFSLCRMAL